MFYRYDVEYRYTAPGWDHSQRAVDSFIAENEEDAERRCVEWNKRDGWEVTKIIMVYKEA